MLPMLLRTLYIIYTWLFFAPVFVVLTFITAVVTIAGCLLGGEKVFAYYPGMIWSRLTCLLALCPVTVEGRENVERGRSYVFVSNHQGAFDIFLIYGFLGVPVKWIMKASIGRIPFVGAACRAAGFIFVDHSTPKAAAKSVKDAGYALRNGTSVVVFPEGSRTHTGRMSRFKRGAYQIATEHGLPAVPITLNGTFHVLPVGSLHLRRHRMEMIIHPAVSASDYDKSHKGLQQMADDTRRIIASALWEEFKDG